MFVSRRQYDKVHDDNISYVYEFFFSSQHIRIYSFHVQTNSIEI